MLANSMPAEQVSPEEANAAVLVVAPLGFQVTFPAWAGYPQDAVAASACQVEYRGDQARYW